MPDCLAHMIANQALISLRSLRLEALTLALVFPDRNQIPPLMSELFLFFLFFGNSGHYFVSWLTGDGVERERARHAAKVNWPGLKPVMAAWDVASIHGLHTLLLRHCCTPH
ncbi:hypothetical protein GOODEAATRI_009101 [Goodea atripinnis]|uniref:Uncharacterized protein n=1 Tax=Goodea atripinnis TaxID=208336 RepID=A0ABV0MR52_9TELE